MLMMTHDADDDHHYHPDDDDRLHLPHRLAHTDYQLVDISPQGFTSTMIRNSLRYSKVRSTLIACASAERNSGKLSAAIA